MPENYNIYNGVFKSFKLYFKWVFSQGVSICDTPLHLICDTHREWVHSSNKMNVRIRNSEWESDGELQRELSKYVIKGLQRNEILSYRLRDFPQYSWSIKALDGRMRYFNIFYDGKNVSLIAGKETVKLELNGWGKLLGYRAMHLKIRQKKLV